jgi:nicotinate-nucleotide adenylyltransferase
LVDNIYQYSETLMQKRIGIFGGSFDPIHYGHLIAARAAAERLRLDRVILVPAGNPPHKKAGKMSASGHRMRMARLAVGNDKLFVVSDHEIRSDKTSYTVDTLRVFRKLYPSARLFLLVGADQAELFSTWREPDQLFALAGVCVLSRPGSGWDKIEPRWAGRIRKIEVPAVEISASDIRKRVRAGKSIRYLVPEPVSSYISSKKIYR